MYDVLTTYRGFPSAKPIIYFHQMASHQQINKTFTILQKNYLTTQVWELTEKPKSPQDQYLNIQIIMRYWVTIQCCFKIIITYKPESAM